MSNLAELRREAKLAIKNEATERRVYNLPVEMVARIIKHQIRRRFPSEVMAVRDLLEDALLGWEARNAAD